MGRILFFGYSHIYVRFGFSILFHFNYYLNISLGLWKIVYVYAAYAFLQHDDIPAFASLYRS